MSHRVRDRHLLAAVERDRIYRDDGHRSTKGFVLATLDGAPVAAARRVRTAPCCRSCRRLARPSPISGSEWTT
ncbi:MAG: hypothetical protein R2705_03685 [Ilumatobacteraceae bacterium]